MYIPNTQKQNAKKKQEVMNFTAEFSHQSAFGDHNSAQIILNNKKSELGQIGD
jgi:hypothetical protein